MLYKKGMSERMLTGKDISRPSPLRAKHVALPSEHGAWVFLFSPLLIGMALGGFRPASLLLLVAALSAFLIRQPITIAVKAYSGRRPRTELPAARFWMVVYGTTAGLAAVGLMLMGYAALFWLAVPALPVMAWHLWLVRRRAERRQALMEIVAGGALALAAPAAFWVGLGQNNPFGWWLWALCWAQTTGSILYAYLRLEQRVLPAPPPRLQRWQMAAVPLLFNLAVFGLVLTLSLAGVLPRHLPLAFLIQPLEVVWGAENPAVRLKPKTIGIRQFVISSLFTLAFILLWRMG
jgi:hypothetical protein